MITLSRGDITLGDDRVRNLWGYVVLCDIDMSRADRGTELQRRRILLENSIVSHFVRKFVVCGFFCVSPEGNRYKNDGDPGDVRSPHMHSTAKREAPHP